MFSPPTAVAVDDDAPPVTAELGDQVLGAGSSNGAARERQRWSR